MEEENISFFIFIKNISINKEKFEKFDVYSLLNEFFPKYKL